MLVSIIITTRNSSGYIEKTLDAILSQTYKNFEVLIVDDASFDVDRLQTIVSKYSESFPINLILQNNKTNASCTRNVGMRNAKGEVLSFLDADDIWYENKLEMVINFFKQKKNGNKPFLVFHQSFRGTYEDLENGNGIIVPDDGPVEENIVDYLLNDHGVIQTSTISINKYAANILLFDESLPRHQDVQFCFDAFAKGVYFHFIKQPLSCWVILDRSVNAHVKGANVDFCINWLSKNELILSDKNKISYISNVLYFISIKEKRFLKAILASFRLLGWNAFVALNAFGLFVLKKFSLKIKRYFFTSKINKSTI
ncbi:glycosyltransferase family 2 protein [Cedecea colo]|uniref:Glycosyltransferase family 2 protein n=1 Tax=Cedecea colo TaxID=2552946 RepID=A0ABX0VGU1_9ENTR|nr:glycosyltransferase family 2 protein [Cedecea colo]NIY46206.1 glycosyltransferase family 2 protein [Cedecea colo]